MINKILSIGSLLFATIVLFGQPAYAQSDIDVLIDDIISDVVTRTTDKAKEVVETNTGIDTSQRGYTIESRYESYSGSVSDGKRRELNQLEEQHDREIKKLEEELNRKLDKAKTEFEREAAKEDKPEKVKKKRSKLEKKVDKAYQKFDEKVERANRKYNEKRNHILARPGRIYEKEEAPTKSKPWWKFWE